MSKSELTAEESFVVNFESKEAKEQRKQKELIQSQNIDIFKTVIGYTFEIEFEYPISAILAEENNTIGFTIDHCFNPIFRIPDNHIWNLQEIISSCCNEFYANAC